MPTTFLKNPVNMTGTALPATSASGVKPPDTLTVAGTTGQETTGTGQTAGAGADVLIRAGSGGHAPSGSTNGGGGSVTINPGVPGGGAGAAASPGNVFIATLGGGVAIGPGSPATLLHVAANSAAAGALTMQVADDSANSTDLRMQRSRGTLGSPVNLQNGDDIGAVTSSAYSGGFLGTARINFTVDGTFTGGQRPPSRISFWTNTANGSPAERVRIDASGKVNIGDNSMSGKALNVYSGVPGRVAIFQAGAAVNGDQILSLNCSAVTGNVYGFSAPISATNNVLIGVDNTGSGNAVFESLVEGAGDAKATFGINGGQKWAIGLDNSDSDSFKISGNVNLGTSDCLTILTGGNVGIGTAAPGSKLHVNGGVQVGTPTGGDKGAGSINVSGDVYKNGSAFTNPDYVFEHHFNGSTESGYAGPVPLGQLEDTIKADGQLPGIGREPLGLFGRQDVLLEKLEEAYLYIIELTKRVGRLEAALAPAPGGELK